MLRIAHLVDDTGPGGVTRYLDWLRNDPTLQGYAEHVVIPVPRSNPSAVAFGADVIVSHLAISWRGLPGLMKLRSRHSGTPMVHVEHSYSEGFVAANVSARRRFFTLLRCAYALFDRVVAVSETQGQWMVERGVVSEAALNVIHPCVDLAAFRALAAPAGPVREFGMIGRFDRQKGFDIAIAAFRGLDRSDVRLHLFGDGAERAALMRVAGDDARIIFHPFVSDPAAAMGQCDVLLMPSRWEPYGIVAQEARAAARPLVVAPVDGLVDHIRDGAMSCQGRTVSDWTETMQRLCDSPTAPRVLRDVALRTPERSARLAWIRMIEGLCGRQGTDPLTLVA